MIQIFLVYIKYIYFALDLPLLNVEVTAEQEEGYTLTIYLEGQGETASPPDPAQGAKGGRLRRFPLRTPFTTTPFLNGTLPLLI